MLAFRSIGRAIAKLVRHQYAYIQIFSDTKLAVYHLYSENLDIGYSRCVKETAVYLDRGGAT